jgi:hypothetical protein
MFIIMVYIPGIYPTYDDVQYIPGIYLEYKYLSYENVFHMTGIYICHIPVIYLVYTLHMKWYIPGINLSNEIVRSAQLQNCN